MNYGRFPLFDEIAVALARVSLREEQGKNQGEAGPSGARDN